MCFSGPIHMHFSASISQLSIYMGFLVTRPMFWKELFLWTSTWCLISILHCIDCLWFLNTFLPHLIVVPFLFKCNHVIQDDGYIPKHSVLELQKAWPGSEVRWVTGGHVSSFILHNGEFRKAIVDGLNRLQWKESSL